MGLVHVVEVAFWGHKVRQARLLRHSLTRPACVIVSHHNAPAAQLSHPNQVSRAERNVDDVAQLKGL
mgnify:CR=1 FL=1